MKMVLRIVAGLVGLVVIVLGVRQFTKGVHEMSGKGNAPAQKMGETYTSTESGYSHRIPQGWESKPGPQPGVTMIVAPKESGLASNMVATVETFAGSLNDYVEANKQALKTSVPDAKILSDSEFVTDAKAIGHKVKLQNKMKDVDLAQTMYFFDGTDGRKVIVTCTAPGKFGSDLDPLFDDCMKTFALASR